MLGFAVGDVLMKVGRDATPSELLEATLCPSDSSFGLRETPSMDHLQAVFYSSISIDPDNLDMLCADLLLRPSRGTSYCPH